MWGCANRPIATCGCETAEEAREHIRKKIAAGESKDQILAEYKAENGSDALAIPQNEGAMRAIYAVPVAGIFAGGLGVAWLVRRWRKGDDSSSGKPGKKAIKSPDQYDARLDEELRDLDDDHE